ncbi:MAG: DUF3798 domain-containing protein [Clostridiales bacterium]|jgi:hypothetical protein|nr:DUF3798 domain-containing protein [Clostridiales bacterium]
MKKFLIVLLVVVLVVGLFACNNRATPPSGSPPSSGNELPVSSPKPLTGGKGYKIAIYTDTLDQNEEEYRAAQRAMSKYGPDMIIHQIIPINFAEEPETLISNGLALVSDPKVKALIMNKAVEGATVLFEKVKEIRKDVLLIALNPAENDLIAKVADIVMQPNELDQGIAIPKQALKLGAKTFVHYSSPRHMSSPLLSKRRDIMKEFCATNGMEFVDTAAPDSAGDAAGNLGAANPDTQQFILEDISHKVAEYGADTCFFSTNCAMQELLIQASVEQKAIMVQQCCPGPFSGYLGALAIEVPDDKADDLDFIISAISDKLEEKGVRGRFSTWPVPISMLMSDACVEYAVSYCEGEITGRSDLDEMKASMAKALAVFDKSDLSISFSQYEDFSNYFLLLCDYLTF